MFRLNFDKFESIINLKMVNVFQDKTKKRVLTIVLFILPYFVFCQKEVKYHSVRNAEFGYGYSLPSDTGKELIETSDKYEALVYNSTDNSYQIKIFSENYFSRNQKDQKLLEYYKRVLTGEHHEIENCRITTKIFKPANGYFCIEGNRGEKNFIWKTIVSEIPVSGELICNTIIFYYSKSQKNKSLGKRLTEEFGNF